MKRWNTLEEVLGSIWTMLAKGAAAADDDFSAPGLGTVTQNGCTMRKVILREVNPPERLLICHTDRRSPKFRQIQAHPTVSWLFYHAQEHVQLRLTGQARLHTDDALADHQWAAKKMESRQLYCTLEPPGTPADEPTSGLPHFLGDRPPTPEESETLGRKNFAVLVCKIDFMDWLRTSSQGHRRAQFEWSEDKLAATWVIP